VPLKKTRGVYVKGANEVARALKENAPDLLKELKAENKRLAEMVAGTARTLVPVRSGRLAKTIRAGVTAKTGVVRAGAGGVNSVPYAGPIHFGWFVRKPPAIGGPILPQPFLYDALDARRDEVMERYTVAVQTIATKFNATKAA
jgi:hypothetical protein